MRSEYSRIRRAGSNAIRKDCSLSITKANPPGTVHVVPRWSSVQSARLKLTNTASSGNRRRECRPRDAGTGGVDSKPRCVPPSRYSVKSASKRPSGTSGRMPTYRSATASQKYS
jgi:hypothetical protein